MRKVGKVLGWAALAAVVVVSMGCAGSEQRRDELPVTKVVLYQNGVGYFERFGTVEGDELRLRIRPDQINDMLTSLTIIDTSGGKVSSVSLPVERNAQMALGDLPPQVRYAGGLMGVLEAFRGAKVKVSAKGSGATGRVIGLEQGESGWRVSILTDSAQVVPIDVETITQVTLQDRTLAVGLAKALDVTLGEGEWKPIELTVRFSKGGDHKVLMSYISAMPTWKPAYRIVIDQEKMRLQGWAVVDNVSGEDWENVRLSLAAGSPISFMVDLHTPRLPYRADLTHRTYALSAEAPPEALAAFGGGGMADSSMQMSKVAAAPPAPSRAKKESKPRTAYAEREESKGGGGDGADAFYDDWAPSPEMDAGLFEGSVDVQVSGQAVGAVYRYDIGVPVTVPDRSSAMVPIVNAAVEGEDVLYYDPTSGSARAQTTPYRAVRMTNTTGMVLEQGPLTIYKDSTFVGSGLAPQVGADQTVFISYSLEPTVHVEAFSDYSQQEQRLVKVKDGVMTVESYQLQTQRFTLTNRGAEAQVVYLRSDKVPGYELREGEGMEAITQGEVYFVKAHVAGAASTVQEVVQASKARRTLRLTDHESAAVLTLYVSSVDANPRVKAQVEEVLAYRRTLGDMEHRRSAVLARQRELYQRSQELRNNINVLGKNKANDALRADLTKKLAEAENELAGIDRELVEIGERRYATEVQMREAFNGIVLE